MQIYIYTYTNILKCLFPLCHALFVEKDKAKY